MSLNKEYTLLAFYNSSPVYIPPVLPGREAYLDVVVAQINVQY